MLPQRCSKPKCQYYFSSENVNILMIMKRKGFGAAQNSQMDLRINRLKKKKEKKK